MQARARLDEVRRERMPQRMHGGVRNAEFLAGQDDQALQGAQRHRGGGPVHAGGKLVGVARPAAGVGKDQHRVAVELPVGTQVLHHLQRERNHAVLVPLAAAHHQLALLAQNVVHRERKAFAETQPRTVDELDRNTVAPKPDRAQQARDLLAGQHGGKFVVVARADLRKHLPLPKAQHLGEENPGAGHRLADGIWLPALAGFDVQDVVAELVLAQRGRVGPEMLVQDPHGPVVAVPGAPAIMPQGEQLRVSPHRVIRVVVVERIPVPPSGPGAGGGCCVRVAARWAFGVVHGRPIS